MWLCGCVVVLLCCCNVHLTKMCQNGMQEKRESCSLLVVIQKEEHKMERRNGEKHALFYIYFYYSYESTALWHVHLTRMYQNGTWESEKHALTIQ